MMHACMTVLVRMEHDGDKEGMLRADTYPSVQRIRIVNAYYIVLQIIRTPLSIHMLR